MSEEEKVAYIQESIKQARSRVIAGGISLVCGAVFLVFAAIAFSSLGAAAWVVGGIGVFLIVVGLSLSLYYANERSILQLQLKMRTTKTLTCRNCGKPIPQGKYTLCPFCGSALVPPLAQNIGENQE
ncbi:MAG: hypothetical protein ABSC91_06805 [Candidatus Bathyarchaeia archaeon]|jgi:hypothetical protein